MYLQREIEDALWSVSDELKYTRNVDDQIDILKPVVGEFNFRIKRGYAYTRTWKLWGWYDPLYIGTSKELVLMLGCRNRTTPNPITNLNHFLFTLNTTMQHELIHQSQWVYRDPEIHSPRRYKPKTPTKKQTMADYLGDYDEVETMAHDTAMELRFYYPNENPYEILARELDSREYTIPTLQNYMKAFKTVDHPVVRRYLKKLYVWIPYIDVQKPINYRKTI